MAVILAPLSGERKKSWRATNMEKVITLRLRERELSFIRRLSEKEEKDRSSAARKLIDFGWEHYILQKYKEGKLSIGKASKDLDLTISETLDLLAERGIESPIDYDTYLEGHRHLKNQL